MKPENRVSHSPEETEEIMKEVFDRVADGESVDLTMEAAPGTERCDFCNDPAIKWDYPCRDFAMNLAGPLTQASMGDWAACEMCHELIETEARYSLLQRANLRFNPTNDPIIAASLRGLHMAFFANRTGDAVAVKVDTKKEG